MKGDWIWRYILLCKSVSYSSLIHLFLSIILLIHNKCHLHASNSSNTFGKITMKILYLQMGCIYNNDRHTFYIYNLNSNMKKAPVKQSKPTTATTPTPIPKSVAFDAKHYVKGHVTLKDVQFAKEAFDIFDIDQSGSIDCNELKIAMTSLGFFSKNTAIFQMISDLDADGNGTIDFKQWLHLMTCKTNPKDSRENIYKIFSLFDDQKTGFISLKNLRRVANELGESLSNQQLDQLIIRADLDNDGLVSQQQFYLIMTKDINHK